MDVCNMSYPENFFDVAIDKSTIDTILCGENPVLNCFTFLKECQRVVKENNGKYLGITLGTPQTRSSHFLRPCFSWNVKHFTLGDGESTAES